MAASYPTSIRSFTNKVDIVDTIFADHVNVLQDEVRAVEVSLGETLLSSSYSGSFAQTSSWASLSLRLANIEAGLVSGVTGSPYFKKAGDVISPASGTVGISVKTTAGTANLVETRNSANTLRFNVDYDGVAKMGTQPLVYLNGPNWNTITSGIAAAQAAAQVAPFNPFLLAGL